MGRRVKAVITDGRGNCRLVEVSMPTLGDYDCLVRMEACAFCNSTDGHLVNGTFPFDPTYPAILGHESAGIIERTGAKVRHFAVGDRVLRPSAIFPDETLEGYASVWGGFAEFGKIRDWEASGETPGLAYQQKLPPGIPATLATLMIGCKEIYSSTEKINPAEGRRFLVAGAGVTGLLFGLLLQRRGAAAVVLAARRSGPLDFALQHGAADEVELLDNVTGPYDALVETTGSVDVLRRMSGKVRPGGEVYAYAVYPDMSDPSLFDRLTPDRRFLRIDPDEPSAHDAVCGLVTSGKIDLAPFLTHTFPLDRFDEAWRTVCEKRTVKTVVTFDGESNA